MDNVNNKQLSFPQRNWLLLCIIVAILSPIMVHLLQSGAQRENYNSATKVRPAMTDTSYKMSSPPGNTASPSGNTAAPSGNTPSPAGDSASAKANPSSPGK